jgi:hypothetical protein
MTEEHLERLAADQKEAYYTSQPMDKSITRRQIEEYLA